MIVTILVRLDSPANRVRRITSPAPHVALCGQSINPHPTFAESATPQVYPKGRTRFQSSGVN